MLDADARIPSLLTRPGFVAVPLTRALAALDHAAYVASPDVIRAHSDGRWPVDGFTLADDLPLVAQHEAEHAARRAFAFVLLTPARDEALGCVYLNPLREYAARAGASTDLLAGLPRASAVVTFWVRQERESLTPAVARAVNDWVLEEWPLERHLFRVLPTEEASCAALDSLPLRRTRLELPGETRPYLWYEPLHSKV